MEPENSKPEEEEGEDEAKKKKSWEDVIRRMLPPGAPMPDEEQLDFSIAVEYEGPSFPFDAAPKIDPLNFESLAVRSPSLVSANHIHGAAAVPKVSARFSQFRSSGFWSQSQIGEVQEASSDCDVERSEEMAGVSSPGHSVSDPSSFREANTTGEATFNTSRESENGIIESCSGQSNAVGVVSSPLGSQDQIQDRGVVVGSRGVCSRCGKGNRLKDREACIVCDAKYCKNCVLKAMGSMPEGRKCVACIGQQIDEAKRPRLGKCSRILSRMCDPLEVKRIMKAEKECLANQLRAEQLVINGRPLRKEELTDVLCCSNPPRNLIPGKYWYDKDSGLWGKEGDKPDQIISSKLNVGGKLQPDASKGNTGVYMNGREITKTELRVLKLANVQCPRDTHFWVYDDGSYEEEGQNNIKGNIWGKASTRFICSLFSLPVPPVNAHVPKELMTSSNMTVPEYLEQGEIQKLLLLGLEGAGTSTIFKQAKFLYGNKFTPAELHNIKLIIQSNLYKYISVLLEERECFEEEVLMEKMHHRSHGEEFDPAETGADQSSRCIYSINQRLKHFSDWLLDIMAMGDLDAFFPAATREYAPVLDEVWKNPAIQETYKRSEELQILPDVAKYFLDRAIEISGNEYEPSEEDILYAEGITQSNGLSFMEFTFDDWSSTSETYCEHSDSRLSQCKYQLIRINSKGLYDGRKWMDMFEDVSAVIFCVDLSDYGEMCGHSSGSVHNKMLLGRDLFERLVRLPSFRGIPFVLFLNKYDSFEDKVGRVPLTVCEWFHDFKTVKSHHNTQSLAHHAYYYIAMKFKELYASIRSQKLFVWPTRARERATINQAFLYVREVIRWCEDKDKNMYTVNEDDSFYTTEY